MYQNRKRITIATFIACIILGVSYGQGNKLSKDQANVRPTKEQLAWANSEIGVIIHLDINIYAPNTFDYSNRATLPDVNVFNPTQLNADQWIKIAKAAGAKYAILTTKHGTGFCLWPSKVNSYNVGHTKWRNGEEDIVKDFVASCKKYGIKPGFYYNTNNNTFYNAGYKPFINDSAQIAYNTAVLEQLSELWSNYGPMFEIWFDGGIKTGKMGIQSRVLELIRKKQPQAILFQGPLSAKNIIRWVGNEAGIAAYPQWSRTNATTSSDGVTRIDGLHGDPNGKYWCPAESDFPIRNHSAWNGGWLWKAGEDSKLRTVDKLVNKYYTSVGRNTNMLIGMEVDTSGLIPKSDSILFTDFGKRINQLFSKPIAKAENCHKRVVQFVFPMRKKVSRVVIEEDQSKGENILSYSIEAWIDHGWKEVANGQSVGHKRIQMFDPVITKKIRFKVNSHTGSIAIKEIDIY
jgi:alpha-L-fucosidase